MPSVKVISFIMFLLCTKLISFLPCTPGSPKNTDPAFGLAKAGYRRFPGLVRLGEPVQVEKGTDLSQVSGNQEGRVCLFPLSCGNNTGKNKTDLHSTQGTAQFCLFLFFSISSLPKSGGTHASVCRVSAKAFTAILPLSMSETPESRDLNTHVTSSILPTCTTSCSPFSSASPLPLQLSFQQSLLLLKEDSLVIQTSVSFTQGYQRTPMPGRESFLF